MYAITPHKRGMGFYPFLFLLLISVMLIGVMLTGCLPQASDKITLKVALASESQREFLKPLLDLYSSNNPEVDFEVTTYGYVGLYKTLLEDASTQEWKFDVVFIDDPWVAGLHQLGYLRDLTREFQWKPDEDILPIFSDSAKIHGDYYAIPVIGNIQIFVLRTDVITSYCKDLLKGDMPQTWEDVLSCAKRAYQPSRETYGYIQRTFSRPQEGNYNPLLTDWLPIYYSYGGFFKVNREGLITDFSPEALIESAKLLKELMDTSFKSSPSSLDYNDHERVVRLLGGKKLHLRVAMGLIWPMGWACKVSSPDYAENPNAIAFSPLPEGPKGRYTILGVWHVAIPVTSKEPEESFKFIKWLASREVQRYYGSYGGVPTRRSALDDPAMIMTYPFYGVITESLRYVKSRPRTPYWVNYERGFGEALRKYLMGRIDERGLVRGFYEAIEALRNPSSRGEALEGGEHASDAR